MEKNVLILITILALILIAGAVIGYYIFPDKETVTEPQINTTVIVERILDDSQVTQQGIIAVVNGNNQFSYDMYKNITEKDKNVFFSPFSISSAFAITYEGARNKTATQMLGVFRFPADDTARRSAYARLYNNMNTLDKNYTIKIANSIWPDLQYKFLTEYITNIDKYYDAKETLVDYIGNPESSRNTINSWVEAKTNSKIKDLLPVGSISTMTRLVIANAIYFKANWQKQFDPKNTYDDNFNVDSSKIVRVKMMVSREEKYKYYNDSSVKAIELPYSGGEMSMLIFLPENISKFESELSSNKVEDIKGKLDINTVDLYLPKFKFETSYTLADRLKSLGMVDAFNANADFSGIDGSHELYISNVYHKAFIEVNEEGSEALAATAVVVNLKSIKTDQKTFMVNKPFIFIIQDKYGNIIFLGKVKNPNLS